MDREKYKLSLDLEKWRGNRPDEWIMDRFIRAARNQEKLIDILQEKLDEESKE